ncbi:alpha/beta fold hydrolase [Marivita hallyeonensis]|uniref:Haloacetate dehalogenase n=1 Tax=Marivita hallyeonensis TaxID=996342 RepID=A0A1M5RDQ5_9RHOB|nr:alpha/beta hydrolase [Marivita hallyeonensis]SHH23933.1 haloacetate dehalogenase [Marivita hallyeonensis]
MIADHSFTHTSQTIAYTTSGDGAPLLLLHGFPQTHVMWRPLLPALSKNHFTVAADLRGYGESTKPERVEDMSFRAMADDMVALMASLGHDSFHVAGHDRGGRVAHRMALDHPSKVRSLTVMDIVPTEHLLTNMTTDIAKAYYHWLFLAQPAPFPETMIGHDPDAYFERCLLGFGKASLEDFDPELLTLYRQSWRDPDCIRTMCDDYRAAIEIDWEHDRQDLDRKVTCPALVLYGQDGAMAKLLDVPATWESRLDNMQHAAIAGGHFFPDQSPDATQNALLDFLKTV